MKKIYLILFCLTTIITFSSCDKSLNPKGDYYEKYVLDCILSGDTTYQVALISHSYNVEGFDPHKNTIDPAIAGADLRLWYNDSVFVFRDSIVSRIGNTRYDDSLKIYYLNNIHLDYNKAIEIEALLPNGRRLKSSSTTAKEINFDNQNSSKVIPPVNTNFVHVQWSGEDYYLPKFTITYYKRVNGESERHTLEIPVKYNLENGNYVPVYPGISNQTTVEYDPNTIRTAMESISEGDPDKNNYYIDVSNQLTVYELDQNLVRYYSANSQENSFTVRLDENDYSNIDGGFGIFGSYVLKSYTLKFTPDFITELGYNPVY